MAAVRTLVPMPAPSPGGRGGSVSPRPGGRLGAPTGPSVRQPPGRPPPPPRLPREGGREAGLCGHRPRPEGGTQRVGSAPSRAEREVLRETGCLPRPDLQPDDLVLVLDFEAPLRTLARRLPGRGAHSVWSPHRVTAASPPLRNGAPRAWRSADGLQGRIRAERTTTPRSLRDSSATRGGGRWGGRGPGAGRGCAAAGSSTPLPACERAVGCK